MAAYYSVRHHPSSGELGLPQGREFVFPGLFLAWLVLHDLISSAFIDVVGEETLAQLKTRALSGPELLSRIDGIIEPDMLLPDAREFADNYFCLVDSTAYLEDFQRCFGIAGSSSGELYAAEDSWENYDALATMISRSYSKWRTGELSDFWT